MNRLLAALLATVALAAPMPALAASSGSVPAQVEVAAPCIIVGAGLDPNSGAPYQNGSIDFGTLAFSTDSTHLHSHIGSPALAFQNCGVAPEHIYGNGQDATDTFPTPDPPTAVWSLISGNTCDASLGLNKYRLDLTVVGTTVTLANAATELESMPSGYADTAGPTLTMPCSGSDGAGLTMGFPIVLTATF